MPCFLKRALPFVLAFAVGLTIASLFRSPRGKIAAVTTKADVILEREPAVPGVVMTDEGVGERLFGSREVDQKARILSRPQPEYTDEARANYVEGTVILRAIFSADGTVKRIRAIRGLPYGLTDTAIDAAQRIEFSPAMKNGRVVSQYIQIEYNFRLD